MTRGVRCLRADVSESVREVLGSTCKHLPSEFVSCTALPQTTRMFLSSKVSGKVNWLFPPFMRMKQYLRHYANGKAADSVVTNTHTLAAIILPKWSTLEPFTKDKVLLKSFEPGTSLFVDPAGAAFPPTNFGFQLWYDGPTALYKSNCHLLGANWNQPDRPSVAINISTAAPNLKMLFHGVLAGLPAVVLADSGASHTLI